MNVQRIIEGPRKLYHIGRVVGEDDGKGGKVVGENVGKSVGANEVVENVGTSVEPGDGNGDVVGEDDGKGGNVVGKIVGKSVVGGIVRIGVEELLVLGFNVGMLDGSFVPTGSLSIGAGVRTVKLSGVGVRVLVTGASTGFVVEGAIEG